MTTLPLPDFQTKYVKDPYNAIVDVYVKNHFDEKIFDPILEKFSSYLPKRALILDAGCGPGGETKKLLAKGHTVKSIDISESMLQKAIELVPEGDFQLMDIMNLNFPTESFDGIWSARALIHIPTKYLQTTFKNCISVLKPGGVVCLTVLEGEQEGIEPEMYDETGKTATFFRYYQKGELEDVLQSVGMKIIETVISFRQNENQPHISVLARKQ